jgi:phage I-like protein
MESVMKIPVNLPNDVLNHVHSIALGGRTDGPPARVLLAPWGEVRSRSGTFVLDEDAARLTVEAFAAQGNDLPIDYEHQSLGGTFSSPSGQAPAAGWIKGLTIVSPNARPTDGALKPGLWAQVEWTPQAAEQLHSRQYRYLSPVVLVRRGDRRMVGLHSAALTNRPAIPAMSPIVNRLSGGGDPRGALCEWLGLEDSVGDTEIIAAVGEHLAALLYADVRRAAEDRVAKAFSAGKLIPAQKEWALELAMRDPTGFDEWMAVAPVVVVTGRTRAPNERNTSHQVEHITRRARNEYHEGGALLAAICSEDAYVRDALRQGGLLEERSEPRPDHSEPRP